MLNPKFVVENLDLVRGNCALRRTDSKILQNVITLDALVKDLQKKRDALGEQRNKFAENFRRTAHLTDEERKPIAEEGRKIKEATAEVEEQLKGMRETLERAVKELPNLHDPEAPLELITKTQWGKPITHPWQKNHIDIAEGLDIVDFVAGSQVAGSKFYYLRGDAVLLEFALVQWALQKLLNCGFRLYMTPDVARKDIVEGIGFNPKGENSQIYNIENSDLCLIGTAEITLGGMHRNNVFDEDNLPHRIAGVSHCFRTEAGAPGADARGLFRVHQFTKVEMFMFTAPEQSKSALNEILKIQESFWQDLKIPYQVIDTPIYDLGAPAARKFDIEAWMPGRGVYAEVTSTSNCTDFQARRLNIRSRKSSDKPRFVHTLNGTAIAVPRTIIAILENFLLPDGKVLIPKCLQPWMNKEEIDFDTPI